MYTTEILKSSDELEEYQQKTFEQIGVMFPLEYLQASLIRVFKSKKTNAIIGGYALVLNHKLRTLDSLPEDFYTPEYNEKNTLEVTGLWLDRNIKKGSLSFKFWIHFCKDVYLQKDKDFIVYAYDLKKKKLQSLYAKGSPTIIYRGETKKLKGMLETSIESIEVIPRKRIPMLPFINLSYLIQKILKKRNNFKVSKNVPKYEFN